MTIFVYPRSPEEIELRFTPRNEELVRLGLKICTVRRTQHGEVLDTFKAAGERWQLLAVLPTTLREAADYLFRLEGESSPEEFLRAWAQAYGIPRDRVDPRIPVYAHIFGWVSAPRS